jgi:hypothetical protein
MIPIELDEEAALTGMAHDVSSEELKALVAVHQHRTASLSQEMIKRLEERGLIEQTLGGGIRLTRAGENELARALKASRQARGPK